MQQTSKKMFTFARCERALMVADGAIDDSLCNILACSILQFSFISVKWATV